MMSIIEKVIRKTAQGYLHFFPHAFRSDTSTRLFPVFKPIEPLLHQSGSHPPLLYHPYLFIEPGRLARQFIFTHDEIPLRHRSDKWDYQNPAMIAYWGLTHLNEFHKSGNNLSKDVALRMGTSLISHATFERDCVFLKYQVNLPRMHVENPWVSCLAQGLAASLFLRLYAVTGDQDNATWAIQCIRTLLLPVDQGGTLQTTIEGCPWMEEYPGTHKTHVLNGFLFALIGMIEAGFLEPAEFHTHIDVFHRSLSLCFPKYRVGHFLRYDRLHADLCNPHYMGLHVMLFYHLYKLTKDETHLIYMKDIARDTDWSLYAQSIGARTETVQAWGQEHLDIVPVDY